MTTIQQFQKEYTNTPEYHKHIHESFIEKVNADEQLNKHRTFVEKNVFGFGERSFPYMWELLVKDMPKDFVFLEVGVFRGQILSLIELLAKRHGKIAHRIGVTPLSPIGIDWKSDYEKDIERIHDEHGIEKDYTLIVENSTSKTAIEIAKMLEIDLLYIDGGHDYETALSDLVNYSPSVKKGGYLIIDDAANNIPMPWGFFCGIQDVTQALVKFMETERSNWEFVGNVVHNMVYRRV